MSVVFVREYSPAEKLALLPADQRLELLSKLSDAQTAALPYDWRFWARPNQLPPVGRDWTTWALLAGRGFGKTRCGAEWVKENVLGATPLSRGTLKQIGIIAETAADARDVIVEGPSGILSIHAKDFRPNYEPSKRRLTWPNGATAILFNATEPDQLRGPQFDGAWCDELAKWRYAKETWDMLQFGLRLGYRPRQVVTTTPRPIPLLRTILNDPDTVVTKGSTLDNTANLATSFINTVVKLYAGTRLGRQELEAEMLDDTPGALWSRDTIEDCRRPHPKSEFDRIIVAVDPSGARSADDDKADEIGIIVVGKVGSTAWVIEDLSFRGSPAQWGAVVINAYKKYRADAIVAEINFGGALVTNVMRSIDPSCNVREVTASRGKWLRAEPVAALYAQRMVFHIGAFPTLEDQLCQFNGGGYTGGGSPDRADALVWGVTDLLIDKKNRKPKARKFGH